MKINRIELENIKKYDNAVITLSEGVNFISGKNGAGKTTIIESIGFALFDYKVTKQNFSNYFIRKGEKKGQVRVLFEDKNGNEYIADRKISQSSAGNSWSIKKQEGDEEIAIVSKDEDVIAWIKDHLEFYEDDNITDIYTNIVSVPQGEFTVAFLTSDNERKKIFDPIFNLESYKEAYNNIRLEAGVSNEIRELENDINIKLGETKRLEEIEVSYENLKTQHINEKDKYNIKYKEFEQIKNDYELKDKAKQSIEKLANDKKIAELQLEKVNEYLKQKNIEIENSKKALELVKTNEHGYNEYLKLENEKKEVDAKYKEYLIFKESLVQYDKRIEAGTSKVEEKDKYIEKQKQELHTKKQELIVQNTENEAMAQEINEREADFQKGGGSISNQKNDVQNISEQIIKLRHMKKDILNLLKSIENPKREQKKLEEIKHNAQSISEDEAVTETMMNNASNIINKTNELINGKSAETKEADLELKKVTDDIEKIKNDIQAKMMTVLGDTEIFDEEAMFEVYKKKVESIGTNFDTIKIEIEKAKVQLEQRQKQLDKEKTEYLAKQNLIKQEEEEKNKWLLGLEKLKAEKIELENNNITYENIEKKLEEYSAKLDGYKKNYELYISNRTEALKYEKLVEESKHIEEDRKQKEVNLNTYVNQIQSLNKDFDEKLYNDIKLKYEEYKQELVIFTEQLKVIDEQKTKQEAEIKYMKELKEKVKESENRIKKLVKVNDVIKKMRNIIKSAPEYIAEVLIKNVSSKASEMYTKIALDSTKLEWEKNYDLVLYDILNGVEIRKEFKQLSGGEQMTAALATRLAMLELMTKLGIGILDEPTVNMDTNRRERLAEVIESVGVNFRQLIIVSHDDTFQSVTENNIIIGNQETS